MTVPLPCRPIAAEIDALKDARSALQAQLPKAAGAAKWDLLQQIGEINAQIVEKQDDLSACVLANAAGYQTEIIVYDLAGSTVLPYRAQLWELGASPGPREGRSVVGSSVTFAGGGSFPGASVGISVHDAPGSIFPGALFRSGPMAELPPGSPGDLAGLIEIGVPAVPPVPLATITASFPPLPMTTSVSTNLGTLTMSIVSLGLVLAPGVATLTVIMGTTIPSPFGPIALPFTYTLPVTIQPSANMTDVTEICVVVASGDGTLTTAPGPLDFIVVPIVQSIAPQVRPVVVRTLQATINSSILSTAAATVGLTTLPAGVVVSMRRVVIATGGIVVFPALGAFGGLLNKITLP